MKIVAVLSVLLVAASTAFGDDQQGGYSSSRSSEEQQQQQATPLAAPVPLAETNPANVVFRTIQAPNRIAASSSRQQAAAVHVRPVTFFSAAPHQPQQQYQYQSLPQPQPQVIRYVQQASVPAPIQPFFARFVQQHHQHQEPAAPVQPVFTRVVQQLQPAPLPVVTRTVLQPAPVVTRAEPEPEPVDPNPSYAYGYQIESPESGVQTSHKETRSNGEVRGEYSVVDPDGSLRTTTYVAGPDGYNAEVTVQKGFAPAYQHHVVAAARREPAFPAPAPAPATQYVFSAPAPVPRPVKDDDSREATRTSFVDANVVNIRAPAQQQTSFFTAAAPSHFQHQQAFAAPVTAPAPASVRYVYVAVPQQHQHQRQVAPAGYRLVSSGGHHQQQQFLANPYSFIRSVPAAPAPAPTAFASSGTSFTRILHTDGTTVEY